ncbi:hypothetical protein IAR55_004114 [Kwoniella newhampshirensis]|uniref:Zn(2)-C6 fungal-type domain-containing protein n=1 Tax=Kwoniella newhampshirensis TaxID=1651941 RepID=A0AAW0YYH1_9TREE
MDGSVNGTSSDGQTDNKKQKRHISHVSRACDRCRKRKTRCNGAQPVCDVCSERGWACEYEEEDKRKTNRELEDLKERVAHLERIVLANNDGSQATITPTSLAKTIPLAKIPASSDESEGPSSVPSPAASTSARPVKSLPRRKSMTNGTPAADLLRNEDDGYERLQRSNNGPLIHYGATSIWTHQTPAPAPDHDGVASQPRSQQHPSQRMPGEWVDWSRNLPPGLVTDKATHDAALAHFAAYFAPWCLMVDMPAFLEDMAISNLVGPSCPPAETRTTYYTPLLHCCVLFLGLHILGGDWPTKVKERHEEFTQHCTKLFSTECDQPSVSSLRALNLMSTCQNLRSQLTAGSNLGYTYFAMAFGMVQVLGVNINRTGLSTSRTFYEQLPLEDPLSSLHQTLRFRILKSCRTRMTIRGSPRLHIKVQISRILGVLLTAVMDILYSPLSDSDNQVQSVKHLAPKLERWYAAQPIQNPTLHPLPHVISMHMTYHLTTIFLYRPFYRDDLDVEPSPANKCNLAANSVLSLLQTFDRLHSIRHGPATFINIVFTASTIFLLKAVGDLDNGADMSKNLQDIDDMISFMRRLSETWHEAEKAKDVLIALRAEWLPGIDSGAISGRGGSSAFHPPQTTVNTVVDTSGELHEWFMNQDFYQNMFSNGPTHGWGTEM